MHSAAAPFNSTSFQNLGFHTRRAHIHSKAPCARQECAVLLNRSRKRRGNSIQWHSDTLCHNVGGHVADAAADRVWMDGSVKSVYKEFPFQCPACLLFVCPESKLYSSLRRLDSVQWLYTDTVSPRGAYCKWCVNLFLYDKIGY